MSRKAVEKLAKRIADTQRAAGKEVNGEKVRQEAVRIAHQSERESPHIVKNNRGGER